MFFLKLLSSILVPPFGVYLEKGIGKSFFLNIVLTLMGIVPGVVHALWCLNDDKQSFSLDRLLGKK